MGQVSFTGQFFFLQKYLPRGHQSGPPLPFDGKFCLHAVNKLPELGIFLVSAASAASPLYGIVPGDGFIVDGSFQHVTKNLKVLIFRYGPMWVFRIEPSMLVDQCKVVMVLLLASFSVLQLFPRSGSHINSNLHN